MKTLRITTLMIGLMTAAPSAFASGGRVDNSGIVVWTFLGFCALIVVAQLAPVLLLIIENARNAASSPELAEQEAAQ